MKPSQLAKMIDQVSIGLSDDVENSYYLNVNRGGCGYVALKLYDILSQKFDCKIKMFCYQSICYKHKGRLLTSLTSVLKVAKINNFQQFSDKVSTMVHLVVEVKLNGKVYLIDSTGLYLHNHMLSKYSDLVLVKGHFTRKQLQQLWDNPTGWNSTFNREEIVPVIDETINRNLAPLLS